MNIKNSYKVFTLLLAATLFTGCGGSHLSEAATPIEGGEVAPDEAPSDAAQPENGEELGV